MKKLFITLIAGLFATFSYAQYGNWHYATMSADSAQELKAAYPEGIEILETNGAYSAVYVEDFTTKELHQNMTIHGPGYVYKKFAEDAISFINHNFERIFDTHDYTITEDDYVLQCMDMVDDMHIENTILMLQDLGTRYHLRPEANEGIIAIRDLWQSYATANGRNDVTFEIVSHSDTPMNSLIMTIPGIDYPDEFVIIGGHADSITWNPLVAPGADDDASGIGTVTEVIRVLLENNFRPARTVQFMAYAAEEIGLVGSDEIAQDYYNDGVNVIGYVQFDMTNYQGSVEDIAINTDSYVTPELTQFLVDLLEHYNSDGPHALTYVYTLCNYACSDHASWKVRGYQAAFPFESKFEESNPFIHTPDDLFSVSGDATHAAKFSKLGLAYVIEAAKRSTLSTFEVDKSGVEIAVVNKELIYKFTGDNTHIESLMIYDTTGVKALTKSKLGNSGRISVSSLPAGVYIATFKTVDGRNITKKFLVK